MSGYSGDSGRGGRGGGRFGRGGRNPGRGRGSGNPSHHAQNDQEECVFKVCKFFTTGTECRFGNKCSYSHGIGIVSEFPAHQLSLNSIAVLSDGPKLLTGSSDNSIKVWNLASGNPELLTTIPTPGAVQHIEVKDNSAVLFSDNENILGGEYIPDATAGVIRLLNAGDGSTLPIKKSEEFPYSHAFPVNRFIVISLPDGNPCVLSCGGDGLVKMWRFDSSKNSFEQMGVLEGHLRSVTSLVLKDSNLWTGSLDTTIRVWDMNTMKCVGVRSAANSGHNKGVTCMTVLPPHANYPPGATAGFIATGGLDGDVKLWMLNGDLAWSGNHGTAVQGQHGIHQVTVTALSTFQDGMGGNPCLIIGLSDGSIMIRSCITMNLLVNLDGNALGHGKPHAGPVNAICSIGHNCFVSGDSHGKAIIWKAFVAMSDPTAGV